MRTLYTLLGAVALFAASLHGQAAKTAAAAAVPAVPAKVIVLSGTTVNVKESGTPVSIRLFRWSTDEERAALVSAFTAPAVGRQGGGRAATPAAAGQGQAQRGQGQGRAERDQTREQPQGQGPDDATQRQDQDEPAQAPQGRRQGQPPQGQSQSQSAQGRGRGGAGGATPLTPFMQTIQKAPTIGYLWTSEPTGYSVKYASRTSQPDGSERVVAITEPRLGAYSPAWTVNSGAGTDYGFTLLEFRITAKTAEGKSSLTSKVVADPNTKQLALEDFAAAPVILTNVKLTTK